MNDLVLVTGGAGYIGSHCALALRAAGYLVVVLDNLDGGHEQAIRGNGVEFVHGDLKNFQDVLGVFRRYNVAAVVHLAAKTEVEQSMTVPWKYYYNNVYGTLNLLSAMLSNGVDKIIFSSTAAVYGEPKYTPIDEEHPCCPINPYGRTKLIAENIFDDYYRAYGLKSVRLRYFNVVGADELGRIGEWHEPETHLVPNILKSLFPAQPDIHGPRLGDFDEDGNEIKRIFTVYGNDYNTKDGTCVRDYVNVLDIASGHVLALRYLLGGGNTDYFNLGTEEGNSVREVLSICEKITGMEIPIKISPRRAGDPAILVANNSKAKAVLGWSPEKTLEDSIKSAYEWEKILHRGLSGA
ncbi:MAG: UDP-glucose 4-epimerase GalE [Puniceicoccales bacterium]|jgi:UDP-glucose 4-epimerase|nr:UDP-glucose 4-epimerase GalE [Puniceicoccales bacterium]